MHRLASPSRRRAAALLLAGLSALPLGAQDTPPAVTEVGGVRYDPRITLDGQALQLNGAGVRFKFVVHVYTAGLYTATRATTAEAVLAAPGAKRMHLVMLRDIDANELGRLFTRGMEENAPREDMAQWIPGTVRMGELFAERKRLATGDAVTVDYLPGKGTVVSINGRTAGDPIREPEFFQALLRIWLGKSPADAALKAQLLGAPAAAARRPGG